MQADHRQLKHRRKIRDHGNIRYFYLLTAADISVYF